MNWKVIRSTKMKCNLDDNDLLNNLNGTVCRYKGIPVQVHCLGGKNLELNSLDGMKNFQIKSTDPEFDISTPPLGYVQLSREMVGYVTRLPKRMWRQGVTEENLKCVSLPRGNNQGDVLDFKLIRDYTIKMMTRDYPSLRKAIKEIKEANYPIEIAISNKCALKKVITRRTVNVYYRNEIVGFIPEKELESFRPRIIVPNSLMSRIISNYLHDFDWEVQ